MNLLECRDLVIGYRSALAPPITLSIHPGELWVVLGRNGSGKTTWFRTVLGLRGALGGQVIQKTGLRTTYVPQRAAYDDLWPVTGADVVSMGADRGWGFLRPGARPVEAALAAVEASALGRQLWRSMSEGQKQRVLLARVIAANAELALLDEPTAAMDAVAEKEAFDLINRVRTERGCAFVVVTHQMSLALERADRVLFIDRELNTAAIGSPAEMMRLPAFRQRYGLLDA